MSDPSPAPKPLANPAEPDWRACLFTAARTPGAWREGIVPEPVLHELLDLVRMGPTSMNCQPLRVVFVRSPAAKARLAAAVNPGNRAKVLAAPVTAILGMEMEFPSQLARLFAHKTDALDYYRGRPAVVADTALRNSSLQGGYFILAARMLGLDCGPMSGFDAEAVDREFWPASTVRTNFLCALGQGDWTHPRPQPPRLAVAEIARFE